MKMLFCNRHSAMPVFGGVALFNICSLLSHAPLIFAAHAACVRRYFHPLAKTED